MCGFFEMTNTTISHFAEFNPPDLPALSISHHCRFTQEMKTHQRQTKEKWAFNVSDFMRKRCGMCSHSLFACLLVRRISKKCGQNNLGLIQLLKLWRSNVANTLCIADTQLEVRRRKCYQTKLTSSEAKEEEEEVNDDEGMHTSSVTFVVIQFHVGTEQSKQI